MSVTALVAPLVRALVHTLVAGVRALWQGLAAIVRVSTQQAALTMAQNSVGSAMLGCSLATAAYVGLLYVWRDLPRDHPTTIKLRMLSAWAACAVAWVPLALALRPGTQLAPQSSTPYQALVAPLAAQSLSGSLGIIRLRGGGGRGGGGGGGSVAGGPVLRSLGHTSVLFALPLVHKLTHEGPSMLRALRGWLVELRAAAWTHRDPAWALGTLMAPLDDRHLWLWRNVVASPLTEEFVFRACMAPLLLLAGCSQLATIFATPLFFGAAHLHHLADLMRHRRMRLKQAAIIVAVQFSYTTVFGWFATWLFLRTGSLWCPVAAHALCNWLGVPDVGALAKQWGWPITGAGLACSIAVFASLFRL